MAITRAQDALLRQLENGAQITYKDEHYVVIDGDSEAKIWPSTFYGLYDQRFVEQLDNGNYTVSEDGKQQIRSKDE